MHPRCHAVDESHKDIINFAYRIGHVRAKFVFEKACRELRVHEQHIESVDDVYNVLPLEEIQHKSLFLAFSYKQNEQCKQAGAKAYPWHEIREIDWRVRDYIV